MDARHLKAAGAVALAAAILGGCGTPETIKGENWAGVRETPRGHELTPEAAIRKEVAGWAVLRCVAGPDVTATKCVVLAETPIGWGFGKAALRGAAGVKVTDATHFAGGNMPALGEVFNLPFIFCPPSKASCESDARAAIAAFMPQEQAAERAVRSGDCATAARIAAATGVESFPALVASACASQSAPKG